MKRIALPLALVLVIAACGDSTSEDTTASTAPQQSTVAATSSTAAATTTVAPTTQVQNELGLVITSVSFIADMVVITNFGNEPIDLGGHWLCQRPSYAEIPSVTLGPGEAVSISLGDGPFIPIPGTKTVDGALDIGGLNPETGELALYSSNDFGASDAIVSYLEWGETGHGRSSVAVDAGIWPSGGFVPTLPDTGSIFAREQPPIGPDGYDFF